AASPGAGLVGRAPLPRRGAAKARGDCRLAVVAGPVAELRERLLSAGQALRGGGALPAAGPVCFGEKGAEAAGQVAFLFPGQGAQYLNMLEGLALYFPAVREAVERADRLPGGARPAPLTQVVFPPPAYSTEEEAQQRRALDQTWFAQPALGAAGYAVYALLGQLGIEPDFVAGHSYGEYVALCAAGALSF